MERFLMRSKTLLALMLFLLTVGVCHATDESPEKKWLSLRAGVGVAYGNVSELVYLDGVLLSRLDWQIWQIPYQEEVLEARFPFPFSLIGKVRSYFPGPSGFLEDRDYLNRNDSVTNFSQSANILDGALFVDLCAVLAFALTPTFTLGPTMGWTSLSLAWHAENGYYQYPIEESPPYSTWNPGSPQFPLYGTSINYQLSSSFLTVGAKSVLILAFLKLEASADWAWNTTITDRDEHLRRDLTFSDSYQHGTSFSYEASLAYRASTGLELFLAYDRRLMGSPEGKISILDMASGISRSADPGYSAGLDSDLFSFTAGVRVLL